VRLGRIETPDLYLLSHRVRIDTQVGVRHDRRVTTDRQRLIADALGSTPTTILEIDDGYDFEVAIVDDEWVFRFPRRSGVEGALELEITVLPALADGDPVPRRGRRVGRFGRNVRVRRSGRDEGRSRTQDFELIRPRVPELERSLRRLERAST
jgi:hypothetical protein